MKFVFTHQQPQAGGATSFYFKPTQPLSWIPGQSIKIEVAGSYGPLEHRFSISSAPYEGQVAITTRNSGSPYKKALWRLQPGDAVEAYGVEGEFIWHHSDQPKLFVAAGIGITPFHSILKERVNAAQPIAVTLLYGSSAGDIIFKDEINQWQASHPEFKAHYIIGQQLSAADVAAVGDIAHSLIYLSGPSAMVDELAEALITRGARPTNIMRDWFTGKLTDN